MPLLPNRTATLRKTLPPISSAAAKAGAATMAAAAMVAANGAKANKVRASRAEMAIKAGGKAAGAVNAATILPVNSNRNGRAGMIGAAGIGAAGIAVVGSRSSNLKVK